MVNYGLGKIYKIAPITGGEDGDIYIGSTTKELLSQRMATHRSNYKQWKTTGNRSKVTSFDLFEKYGIEKCSITLLEQVNASCKDELHARERHYIESMACVNKFIPLRTKREYYEDNKDRLVQKNKEWYENNKESVAQYKKEWAEENRIELTQKRKDYYDKEQLSEKYKVYREDNREAILKRKADYREANREQLATKQREYNARKKQHLEAESST